jgi:hypothetical protein
MRISDYRNTIEQSVKAKQYNIWLGISLGNKYFNAANLEDYIKGSLELSKEKILVIIADQPQAINYEVFENMKSETAMAKAERNGQKVFDIVSAIISELPEENQQKVSLIK